MKFSILLFLLTGVLIISCSNENPIVAESDLIVIQAYLYANEPVTDIRITSTLPLDSEETSGFPINDAAVKLVRNDNTYELVPSPGDSGYYHYPGDDLTVNYADVFEIEIEHSGKMITAETNVPEQPTGVALSSGRMVVPYDIRDFLFGGGNFDSLRLVITWNNDNDELFYHVIDNVDSNPVAISSNFPARPNRFISQPTRRDSAFVNFANITHTGRHRVRIYRVNQEYADLYESRQQDTRDLNEPLTNIQNGLGVFSAFNSDSVFFDVVQQ